MSEVAAAKAAIEARSRVDLAIVLVLADRGESYSREIHDAMTAIGGSCSHEHLRARLVRLASTGKLNSRLKRSGVGGPPRRYYRLAEAKGER